MTRIRTLFPHLQCFVFAHSKRRVTLTQSSIHQMFIEPPLLARSCSWCWSDVVDKWDKFPWWWAMQTMAKWFPFVMEVCISENVNCLARSILEHWLKARLHPGWCYEFLSDMNIWDLQKRNWTSQQFSEDFWNHRLFLTILPTFFTSFTHYYG